MTQRIGEGELQEALASVDPAAVLVAARYLRRVIRLDCDLPGLGLLVPHRKCYVVERDRAREIVHPDECHELHKARIPPTVVLLASPDPTRLRRAARADVLSTYSRRLFHGRIDFFFRQEWLPKRSRTEVRQRIARIGQAAFDEIRAVLRDEAFLLPPAGDGRVYAEFAAVFLEFERYAPHLLKQYFSSIHDLEAVSQLLRADVAADELFRKTTLAGAAPLHLASKPVHGKPPGGKNLSPWESPSLGRTRVKAIRFRFHRLRAMAAQKRGNDVRCALQNVAAYRVAPFRYVDEARAAAEQALARLAKRLAKALELNEHGARDVERLLPTLLPGAAEGFWTQAARLLYDLQNVCVDREKEHYAVDIWSWLFSFGKTPIRRVLPHLTEVLAARHLRSASRRVARVPLSPVVRREWSHLVTTAAYAADRVVRNNYGPLLRESLRTSGFDPKTPLDRVSLDKMVGELLNVIVARGRFSLGDLRDVVSRNDFKIPDVKTFRELWSGGPLLRSDRILANAFDGVYRSGEFYLRWFLQFTSLAYGTRWGRFFVQHFALPVGGAAFIVEGLQHTIFVLVKLAFGLQQTVPFANWFSIAVVAGIIYGCLHNERFASRLATVGKQIGVALRRLFIDWPYRIYRRPELQRFLHSPAFVLIRRAILFPALISFGLVEAAPFLATALIQVFWPNTEFSIVWPQTPLFYLATAFVCSALFFVSPLGRRLENYVLDRVHWTWRRIRFDLVPGLIRGTVQFFQFLMEGLERFLYAVDERLRFHAGESRFTLLVKAATSSVWIVLESVIRGLVNLVVEPQVNPVKHFPVVTVSHKIMIPAAPTVISVLTPIMGTEYAVLTSGVLLFSLPGVCGFLAWELLTNWRLYEANRPHALEPAAFGSHGETMVRMLRPGFHSGTIPKIFAKLRRTRRKEPIVGSEEKLERLHQDLHHVADAVQHFVRRELLRILEEHPAWGAEARFAVRATLASNRVVVSIHCDELGNEPIRLSLEEQSRWLVAGVADAGWLMNAALAQRRAFEWALVGFYKRCGVAIVREQLEPALAEVVPDLDDYDISEEGLIVWPAHQHSDVVFDLRNKLDSAPAVRAPTGMDLATLPMRKAVFKRNDLTWVRWTHYWNTSAPAGSDEPPPWRVLPNENAAEAED